MTETSRWGSAEHLVPRLSSSGQMSIATGGDSLSIIFDDALVALNAECDGFDGWWTTGLAFPVQPDGNPRFSCWLRGVVSKTTSARAVLIASVGGQLTTREFDYGAAIEEQVFAELSFDVSSLAGDRVLMVVAIHAERLTLDDSVTLVLDSLDAVRRAPSPNNGGTTIPKALPG